jgi:hypothetical protein
MSFHLSFSNHFRCYCLFFGLLVTVGGMKRRGLRASFLSIGTTADAGETIAIVLLEDNIAITNYQL